MRIYTNPRTCSIPANRQQRLCIDSQEAFPPRRNASKGQSPERAFSYYPVLQRSPSRSRRLFANSNRRLAPRPNFLTSRYSQLIMEQIRACNYSECGRTSCGCSALFGCSGRPCPHWGSDGDPSHRYASYSVLWNRPVGKGYDLELKLTLGNRLWPNSCKR